MTPDYPFNLLMSDDLYVEGLLASDVASLCRRLARTEQVEEVYRYLASDPDRIRGLAAFSDRLARESHDAKFRHPNDIAICAALLILQSSPLSDVQSLLARLAREQRPSLTWVRRTAEYCREQFVPSEHWSVSVGAWRDDPYVFSSGPGRWSTPESTAGRFEFGLSNSLELKIA